MWRSRRKSWPGNARSPRWPETRPSLAAESNPSPCPSRDPRGRAWSRRGTVAESSAPGFQFGGHVPPGHAQRSSNVPEHDVPRDRVQLDVAAGGQHREAFPDLSLDPPTTGTGQSPISSVKPELGVLMTDEVEDGQAGLVVGQTQAAAELLQEHRRALRRSKEEDGVDCGNVEALVEEVHREHGIDLPVAQALESASPIVCGSLRRDRDRRDAAGRELLGHETRMVDRDAEAERTHPLDVVDLLPGGRDDLRCAIPVRHVTAGEFAPGRSDPGSTSRWTRRRRRQCRSTGTD